jgi:hypothetical protein
MSLESTILGWAPAVVHELEVLVELIDASPTPSEAISSAQKAVLADLADAGTDAALKALMDKGMKR